MKRGVREGAGKARGNKGTTKLNVRWMGDGEKLGLGEKKRGKREERDKENGEWAMMGKGCRRETKKKE